MACHIDPTSPSREDIECAKNGLKTAIESVENGGVDLLVLDELGYAIQLGLLDKKEVINAIKKIRGLSEIVITGGNYCEDVAAIADYLSEVVEIKHHYQQGMKEVEGVDF